MAKILLDELPKKNSDCPLYKGYPHYKCSITRNDCTDPSKCNKIKVVKVDQDDLK